MTIERLREVSQTCLAGEPLDAELAHWLGDRLRDYLECRCGSIEEAFELRFAQGGVPWWKEERMRRRDAALRALAETWPDDLTTGAVSRELNKLAVRYAASAWLIDRKKAEMPVSYEGGRREHLWRAFASGAPMPLGERQIRNIIA
ncbi:MAG: hypothetical protein V3S44_06005 [Alphaproteobacteria bacterium]